MKKQKTTKGFRKGVPHLKESKEEKPIQKRHLILWLIACSSFFVFFAVLLFSNGKKTPKKEAKDIVARAIELTDFIPNLENKSTILHALKNMQIFDVKTDAEKKADGQFVFLIGTPDGFTKGNKRNVVGFMEFLPEHYAKTKQVVVTMNPDARKFSTDLDIKAAGLIHELIHAIQVSVHLSSGRLVDYGVIFNDERQAWGSHAFLYRKARPDMFEGTFVDCKTLTIYNSDKKKEKLLRTDALINPVVLYNFCGDDLLRTLYREKE